MESLEDQLLVLEKFVQSTEIGKLELAVLNAE